MAFGSLVLTKGSRWRAEKRLVHSAKNARADHVRGGKWRAVSRVHSMTRRLSTLDRVGHMQLGGRKS